MKLENKLQIIVDIYLENINSLNLFFLVKEDSYKLITPEKKKMIKYCKNQINEEFKPLKNEKIKIQNMDNWTKR